MKLVKEMLTREKEFIKSLINTEKADVNEKQMLEEIDQVLSLIDKFKLKDLQQ